MLEENIKLTIIAGARPNFIKIAPLIHAIQKHNSNGAHRNVKFRLVHTGQHYDEKLSAVFFKELNIPEPDINLEVGSGSHAVQTAAIMVKVEEDFILNRPDYLLVVGDVNSTMASTITAKKMGIKVIHVEAGLRSYDLDMPEEINRIVTDALADIFFTTTPEAGYNLARAGISSGVHFVGNTMIDSLIAQQDKLVRPAIIDTFGIQPKEFYLMTLHRPSNVDDTENLRALLLLIAQNAGDTKVVFPVHPRTMQRLKEVSEIPENICLTDPMPYLEFIYMVKAAKAVITDSGGIQEESTFLKIPCITLRENTERPETITQGSNELVGNDKQALVEALCKLREGRWKKGNIPTLWDGRAAERIIKILTETY